MLGVEYRTRRRRMMSSVGDSLDITEAVYHEWRCILCDTDNSHHDFFCCFCSHPRDTKMWRCICNMANEAKHDTCEACGGPR